MTLSNPHCEFAAVTVSGFTTTAASDTGMQRINLALTEQFPNRWGSLLLHRSWDSDARTDAWLIDLKLKPDGRLVFVGHSYGAGVYFPALCRELARLGRRVDVAYLVDPVPRAWRTALPWNLVRHALHADTLDLPDNVGSAHVWWQINNYPRGRNVGRGDPRIAWREVFGEGDLLRAHAHRYPAARRTPSGALHATIDDLDEIRSHILVDLGAKP